MKGPKIPYLWTAMIVAVILAAGWQSISLKDASERMETLPMEGATFQGEDLPIKEQEKESLKNANMIKRLYRVDGEDFYITVIDGTKNREIVHDPYTCFTGSGWKIVNEKPLSLENGEATLLDLQKEGEEAEALFWFSDGVSRHKSPFKYWWQTTLRKMTMGYSGAEPVLIVVQPLQKEKVDWDKFQKDFHPLFEI